MKKNKDKELVGVKEIARRANVSIATVDRVIHNRTGVSVKTKDKINAIIEELNYQPNILARRLASKKILQFAALIPAVSEETDYWEAPLNGIIQAEAEIKPYGINIEKYFFDQNDRSSFVKQAETVLENNVQGVLLAPMFIEESKAFVEACQQRQIPYVFINSDIPNQNSLCYIGPHLYRSGYLGAHLVSFLVNSNDKVLVVNISKEIDTEHHVLRKEEGFRAYFADNKKNNEIIKTDIRETDYLSVKRNLIAVLKDHHIKAIFVTNSRVSFVAHYLQEANIKDIPLVGFDFLKENIGYLKSGVIDFLICQKPQEQGYRGIMALYNFLVHDSVVDKIYFMPIDIITKENYEFYRN
ncbi:substrate-binding domain-containing protein [Pedobacter sp. BS3]|uniref:LacI family DNA-binding transcriptional regulator n=1 Tax=Pedobacter sp. BS3 TaxID=2567937 RepID=UPI0011EEB8CE|nr:substrate-binding domain-containing protein [Pedobacter sp. BS3]TZF81436.1 substrate-binding domain-containing protein [Pedobacter sp. BS3]